ncbi:hypothetical protein TIFTF001_040890 [Ficus carica]|uniref:Uncharacterized protein n=1 Tax=Ficus carica TaxID=3494 RepID=A0AA87Z6I5_FICCA|nr:hypothetical protein TIFTF001_040890 [Ficus carica]
MRVMEGDGAVGGRAKEIFCHANDRDSDSDDNGNGDDGAAAARSRGRGDLQVRRMPPWGQPEIQRDGDEDKIHNDARFLGTPTIWIGRWPTERTKLAIFPGIPSNGDVAELPSPEKTTPPREEGPKISRGIVGDNDLCRLSYNQRSPTSTTMATLMAMNVDFQAKAIFYGSVRLVAARGVASHWFPGGRGSRPRNAIFTGRIRLVAVGGVVTLVPWCLRLFFRQVEF